MRRILTLIPAYNEEKNIAKVITELRKDFPETDIVVVNDCSRDNTYDVVNEMEVPCLTLPFNMGYSSALQCGFKYAVCNNYDYVIQFDGDGQHIACEAKKLFEKAIETSADIVIGSRFLNKNQYHHSLFRRIGTAIFRILIKIACGKRITDPTSGLQILSRRCFKLYSSMDNYPEYPDANLIIEMLRKGFKITEVPVLMRNRTDGISMHHGILKPIKYMVVMFYSIFILMLKQRHIQPEKEELGKKIS
jgi:glycosyltransferase involved in cell wall biosynthesis